MIANKTLILPKGEDVRSEAIEVIIERLGVTRAAFFLRETMSQKVDYLKLKEELFGRKTSSDLYMEIKKSLKRK